MGTRRLTQECAMIRTTVMIPLLVFLTLSGPAGRARAGAGQAGGAPEKPKTMTPAEHPEVQSGIRLLEAWIESQMAYRGLPGVSVGIVYDQDLIWSRGFGYADVEKKVAAAPDTIYRIASISKLFTSTA